MSTRPLRVLVLTCNTRRAEALAGRAAQLGVELVPARPTSSAVDRSALAGTADGFLAVMPEGYCDLTAMLQRALDDGDREWAWKPIGFLSHDTRANQPTEQVATALGLVPLRAPAAIPTGEARHSSSTADIAVLDELVRVAHALRPLRERTQPGSVTGPVPGSCTRRLTPDDAAEVTVLQRCCWVEEAIANDTLAIPALHESLDDVRRWLADWHTTGLWLDGRLLGMVRGRRVDADWHLGRLAVVPDLRGHGVGRWLLRTGEAAAAPGCRRVVLFTGAQSLANIALYRSTGYRALEAGEPGIVSLAKALRHHLPAHVPGRTGHQDAHVARSHGQ
ncbi:GNAT family N-acetyltransferase [Dactylosporangium sp. McL0621]|uniref:GNAT family N-acetyltransferase n=1 Tax=Dactylosporangium sp. McL0621 TaxID=3415678 RepID=UPI003CFB833A